MARDWNDELDKYESGRNVGDDLRDSIRTACSAASFIVSRIPDSTSRENKPKDGLREGAEGYGWYVGDFRIDND